MAIGGGDEGNERERERKMYTSLIGTKNSAGFCSGEPYIKKRLSLDERDILVIGIDAHS